MIYGLDIYVFHDFMYLMVIESMLHQLEEVHQATKLVWHNNKEENLGAKFKECFEF